MPYLALGPAGWERWRLQAASAMPGAQLRWACAAEA